MLRGGWIDVDARIPFWKVPSPFLPCPQWWACSPEDTLWVKMSQAANLLANFSCQKAHLGCQVWPRRCSASSSSTKTQEPLKWSSRSAAEPPSSLQLSDGPSIINPAPSKAAVITRPHVSLQPSPPSPTLPPCVVFPAVNPSPGCVVFFTRTAGRASKARGCDRRRRLLTPSLWNDPDDTRRTACSPLLINGGLFLM